MNRNGIEGTEETVCQGCSRIALSHLALDLDEPTNGWSAFFRERSIEMLEDDLGRPSLRREDARAVISERQRWERENAESIRHRQEVVARESRPVHPGLPRPPHADEKLSAFEVMRGADAEAERSDPRRRISPQEELLLQRFGRPAEVITEEE